MQPRLFIRGTALLNASPRDLPGSNEPQIPPGHTGLAQQVATAHTKSPADNSSSSQSTSHCEAPKGLIHVSPTVTASLDKARQTTQGRGRSVAGPSVTTIRTRTPLTALFAEALEGVREVQRVVPIDEAPKSRMQGPSGGGCGWGRICTRGWKFMNWSRPKLKWSFRSWTVVRPSHARHGRVPRAASGTEENP